MSLQDDHYRQLVEKKGRTRLASCGYEDRFDPFRLNKNPRIRALYSGLFREFLADIPCARVLDLGCGTGIYFDVLAEHVGEVEALDLSAPMIETAKDYCEKNRLSSFHPKVGTADALDYADGYFDTVIAFDLLHHVPDLNRVVDEVYRVIKPGGHFFVFEPNICNPLMLFAHLIPKEERLAMGRNRPATLKRSLARRFEMVTWRGVCELITELRGLKRVILGTYIGLFRLTGWERIYPRQVWLGKKGEG